MAPKTPSRDLIKIIINNFVNSLRPRQIKGNFIGEDYFGNKYYEIPANPSIGKRKPSRYFVPTDKEAFDQELTAEWEAWLRGRRNEPPTREELVRNLSIMEMKQRNAAELEATYGAKDDTGQLLPKEKETIGTFPKYNEYEIIPGKDPEKK
ncbi:NADH dehydrogenase [ubiquinone] 1 alpha subcomplex assembly factor 2 [Bactrocera neohumeralis]|uniref:NADH dehydrogenase [ubiquinone] 1 alpha subcomplex assembly factor 2 n=1 Tax=Bactrocera tryoni TaxID=59916 RepID=UPI001A96570B|nr:NADH dehydrogenase [ubiquinone] 1 alpha subcomplex assembly factor 2 [Bactrocera tryoni]XP_050319152.1 NADH dehydrogenase [ubiquinone] 1 alpha subcomplex assembly factor 2 [Bactrocera neohumeralis]